MSFENYYYCYAAAALVGCVLFQHCKNIQSCDAIEIMCVLSLFHPSPPAQIFSPNKFILAIQALAYQNKFWNHIRNENGTARNKKIFNDKMYVFSNVLILNDLTEIKGKKKRKEKKKNIYQVNKMGWSWHSFSRVVSYFRQHYFIQQQSEKRLFPVVGVTRTEQQEFDEIHDTAQHDTLRWILVCACAYHTKVRMLGRYACMFSDDRP